MCLGGFLSTLGEAADFIAMELERRMGHGERESVRCGEQIENYELKIEN
jgi:hypothetical protein